LITAIFIGDEVSAAAFRLAGVAARVPGTGHEEAFLRQASGEADLILISAECAARIPHAVLRQAQAAPAPLLLVVPDVRGRLPAPNPAARLRAQLGMEE
jgi:vacuolar-type H+-ATPase subunit F/Vma7